MVDGEPGVEPPEEAAFRLRLRAWLAENATRSDSEQAHSEARPLYHSDRLAEGYRFHRALWDAGFAGVTVPVAYGGQGLPSRYQEIWKEEVAEYELPPHGSGAALGIAVPMLLAHGSEFLKSTHVPQILRAEVSWCQFLSEPGGGSDLAGVRTSAVRDGDEWVLNGSKIWTTGAHFSQYAMCLARTAPDQTKHRGLTMFVVPIPSVGLEIRPVQQINGGSEFNQEFLDDVRVPSENVVGEVNEGWRVAQSMLSFERQMIGGGSVTGGSLGVERPDDLAALARTSAHGDANARQLVADIWVHTVVAAETSSRMIAAMLRGEASPHAGSALKLLGNEVTYRRVRAAMTLAGTGGIAWSSDDEQAGEWGAAFLSARAAGLGGGTDEIQRNIVGERILGLPREPQVDRDIPFREVPASRN
jgi:alkylation response protein AidB-like acyl-CoA dehydrogenase